MRASALIAAELGWWRPGERRRRFEKKRPTSGRWGTSDGWGRRQGSLPVRGKNSWWLQRLGNAFTCRRRGGGRAGAAAARACGRPEANQPLAVQLPFRTKGGNPQPGKGGQRHTLCTVPSTQLGGGGHTDTAAYVNVTRSQH